MLVCLGKAGCKSKAGVTPFVKILFEMLGTNEFCTTFIDIYIFFLPTAYFKISNKRKSVASTAVAIFFSMPDFLWEYLFYLRWRELGL